MMPCHGDRYRPPVLATGADYANVPIIGRICAEQAFNAGDPLVVDLAIQF